MFLKRNFSEDGTVLVVFALTIIVLLLFVGLAIDAGNLYRAHIALQNAADAASLSGVGYTARRGKFELDNEVVKKFGTWTSQKGRDTKITKLLKPSTNRVVQAIMTKAGFPHQPSASLGITATGVFTSSDPKTTPDVVYQYRVTAGRRIDFLIMDFIPIIGKDFQDLTAVATTDRKVATVVLYLDVSDSMNCPAGGNCDCMLLPGKGPCGKPTKMDELVKAVKTFLKKFDPGRDQMFVVPFNIRGRVFGMSEASALIPYTGPLEDLTESHIDQLVDKFGTLYSPDGSTNICDALMRGRERLERDAILPGTDVSHVLFTDGAPTAGRFLFKNPKAALPAWSRPGSGGTHDYTHYSIEWRDTADLSKFRYGPGVLVQTDLLGMNHGKPEPPAPGTGTDDSGSPSAAAWGSCSAATKGSAKPLSPVPNDAAIPTVAEAVFKPCLKNLGAHLPGDSSRVYGENYDLATKPAAKPPELKTFAHWQEQYYNCAIQLADQLRQEGVVYVIGLGDPATFATNGKGNLIDAYQNSIDATKRHDIFNTRLADDQNRAVNRPQLPGYITKTQAYPEWGYDGYENYAKHDSAGKQGSYLPTPKAAELKLLFEDIAQRILLRMTE